MSDYDKRRAIFEARSVREVFDRVTAYQGTPTPSELRRWVNSVLGPWHIPADIAALCRKEK